MRSAHSSVKLEGNCRPAGRKAKSIFALRYSSTFSVVQGLIMQMTPGRRVAWTQDLSWNATSARKSLDGSTPSMLLQHGDQRRSQNSEASTPLLSGLLRKIISGKSWVDGLGAFLLRLPACCNRKIRKYAAYHADRPSQPRMLAVVAVERPSSARWAGQNEHAMIDETHTCICRPWA